MTSSHGVRAFFERHARAYDTRYAGDALATAWARVSRPAVFERIQIATILVRRLGSPDVLDLGCGAGHGMFAMCEAGARTVTGVDFSATMLEIARRRAAAHPRAAAIQLVDADIVSWSAPARSWDLVVALGVLEYYADCAPLLARIAELSRAWVLFSVRSVSLVRGALRARHYARAGCPIHFMDRASIDVSCERAGFTSWTVRGPRWGSYLVQATCGSADAR